jgi:hypothetical protein
VAELAIAINTVVWMTFRPRHVGLRMRFDVVSVAFIALSVMALPFQIASEASDFDWRSVLVENVSGYNILQSVIELESFGTRDFHTEEAMAAALLIEQRMQELGLETSLQEFEADGVACVNVIGTLNPENGASGMMLFGAHYDSRNRFANTVSEAENVTAPGADDNASGVGAMLEIARILSGSEEYVATTRFVAFGAEERGFEDRSGLAGSSAYVESEIDAGAVYEAAFVMDMIGFQVEEGHRMTIVQEEESCRLTDSVVGAVDRYGLSLTVDIISNESIRNSDHASFWTVDYPSILVLEQLDPSSMTPANPYYHTEFDTSDKLSVAQMEEIAAALVGAALNLTTQGEDSYSSPYSFVVVAAVLTAATTAIILVIRRKRGE